MRTLTQSEALAQGYTHAGTKGTWEGNESYVEQIEKLTVLDFSESEWILAEKGTRQFSISAETLKELVDDYLVNQDEFNDESGSLNDAIEKVDFSPLANTLNEALSKVKYYTSADIKLMQ